MSTTKIIAGVLAGSVIIGAGIWFAKREPSGEKTSLQKSENLFEGWVLSYNEEHKKCVLSQTLSETKTNQKVAGIAFGNLGPKGESLVIFNTPLGILVDAGAAYKIDENKQISMRIQNCTPEGCHATIPLTEELKRQLLEGKTLRLGFMAPNNQSISLDFSLNGFKKGYEAYNEKVTSFGPITEIVKSPSQPEEKKPSPVVEDKKKDSSPAKP